MAARAAAGAPEGTWLRADVQTGGRGRQGRRWISPPGNLYASTIVRLRAEDPPPASLSLMAAVALDATMARFAPPERLRLKWPNDLLLADAGGEWAKLAGILLEARAGVVIAGFGVNLAHAPELDDRRAASLPAAGITAPDPDAALSALASAFALWLARWRDGGHPAVLDRWRARAHPVGARLAVHDADGTRQEGWFDGLDGSGALRLRLASGKVRLMHAGDVFLLPGRGEG